MSFIAICHLCLKPKPCKKYGYNWRCVSCQKERTMSPKKIYDNEFITEILGTKIIAYVWLVTEYQITMDKERRYNPRLHIKIAVRCICSNPERAEEYKVYLEDEHRRKYASEDRFLRYSVEKIWVDHLLGSTMTGERL